jgi:hypothetical protein
LARKQNKGWSETILRSGSQRDGLQLGYKCCAKVELPTEKFGKGALDKFLPGGEVATSGGAYLKIRCYPFTGVSLAVEMARNELATQWLKVHRLPGVMGQSQ